VIGKKTPNFTKFGRVRFITMGLDTNTSILCMHTLPRRLLLLLTKDIYVTAYVLLQHKTLLGTNGAILTYVVPWDIFLIISYLPAVLIFAHLVGYISSTVKNDLSAKSRHSLIYLVSQFCNPACCFSFLLLRPAASPLLTPACSGVYYQHPW